MNDSLTQQWPCLINHPQVRDVLIRYPLDEVRRRMLQCLESTENLLAIRSSQSLSATRKLQQQVLEILADVEEYSRVSDHRTRLEQIAILINKYTRSGRIVFNPFLKSPPLQDQEKPRLFSTDTRRVYQTSRRRRVHKHLSTTKAQRSVNINFVRDLRSLRALPRKQNSRSKRLNHFSRLPEELKSYIWELARPEPRIVKLKAKKEFNSTIPLQRPYMVQDNTDKPPEVFDMGAIPALLHTCHSSRNHALKYWYPFSAPNKLNESNEGVTYFFDPTRDMMYLECVNNKWSPLAPYTGFVKFSAAQQIQRVILHHQVTVDIFNEVRWRFPAVREIVFLASSHQMLSRDSAPKDLQADNSYFVDVTVTSLHSASFRNASRLRAKLCTIGRGTDRDAILAVQRASYLWVDRLVEMIRNIRQ